MTRTANAPAEAAPRGVAVVARMPDPTERASQAKRVAVRPAPTTGNAGASAEATPRVVNGGVAPRPAVAPHTRERQASESRDGLLARATDAARLAAMTGGSLVSGADGRASVVFAGDRPAHAPRSAAPAAPRSAAPAAARSAAPTVTRSATVQRSLSEPAPLAAPIDVDDLYEQIAARLRRDLLLDRERAGELP